MNIVNEKIGIKNLITYKAYIGIICANFISELGSSIDQIAYPWMIYTFTGSKLLMGTIFAINSIPKIIISPFIGVFVDIINKKTILIISNFLRGIIVILTSFLFHFKLITIWQIILLTILDSFIQTFASPAGNSIIPLTIPKKMFLVANSFNGASIQLADILGLACAGTIISLFGISIAILIDGITFIIACIIIFYINVKENLLSNNNFNIEKYFSDLKMGFSFILKNNIILFSIILLFFGNFCMKPIDILMPSFIKDTLKLGPQGMSIISVSLSIGSILGSLLISQFGSKYKPSLITIFGFCLFGINYSFLFFLDKKYIFFISPINLISIIFLGIGFFMPIATTPLNVCLLEKTPKELLGRVTSVLKMITSSAIPIASILTGIISEYLPSSTIFLVMGVILSLISLSITLNKKFMESK